MPEPTTRVWLITGCSSGFGAELSKEVLRQGDKLVATARKVETLKFDGTTDDNFLALPLDVTDKKSIKSAFEAARKNFGRIDVVVNNAGYGLSGPFEQVSDEAIRKQFDINFFGLLDVTREALATMREQKPPGGVIQQITSNGGQIGVANFSVYCATKWAIEGFTEAVQKEMKPEWNIKLTNVEPGGFRTDWSGSRMEFADERHSAYDHIDSKSMAEKRHGTQPGDPAKAAKAMYQLGTLPRDEIPLRACLGSDVQANVEKKIKEMQDHYLSKKFKDIALSCDVDE